MCKLLHFWSVLSLYFRTVPIKYEELGLSFNGRTAVSKTANEGSIPSRPAKFAILLTSMTIKILLRVLITFIVFHLLQFLVFYLLSATFYDGELFVGLPFNIYTISCGFVFQPTGCQWKAFYLQNLVTDLAVWVIVWASISYLKSKLSKK